MELRGNAELSPPVAARRATDVSCDAPLARPCRPRLLRISRSGLGCMPPAKRGWPGLHGAHGRPNLETRCPRTLARLAVASLALETHAYARPVGWPGSCLLRVRRVGHGLAATAHGVQSGWSRRPCAWSTESVPRPSFRRGGSPVSRSWWPRIAAGATRMGSRSLGASSTQRLVLDQRVLAIKPRQARF
jgi:hypothetical protein